MALQKIKGYKDKTFFDARARRKLHKNFKFRIYIGGRNLGKTTRIILTEFQNVISQYKGGKRPDEIKPIGLLVRTEKLWTRIKSNYLNNLRKEPFNIPFVVEGNSLYYVKHYEKTDKQGDTVYKYKRLFKLAEVLFVWSANSYKQGNLEHLQCLIYDEIVPEIDGYIPQELSKFDSLLSTFSRLSDDKYVIGIANNITDECPYYNYIGISPDTMCQPGEALINVEQQSILEYVETNTFIYDLQEKSTAGTLQKKRDYGKMAQGKGFLKSENYAILSIPSGEYTPKMNLWIDNESYVVHQYSKTAYWIEPGNSPYQSDYFLDKESAIRQKRPYDYVNTSWWAGDMNAKLNKNRLWFRDFETREIFIQWLHKNF